MEQRLQKLLASAGIGSRRYCETLITAGRVSVNGKQVKDLGVKADPDRDEIRVDGRPLSSVPEHVYIVLNKPLGYVTTVSDPHAKHTVMDLVKGVEGRIYPVGRLDADSAGLLLLSNDGDFTQKLTHPSHQVPKTYRVVARGEVPEWAGADLKRGVILEDGITAPAEVEWVDYDESNNASIIDITIHEGRNRQVRRMFDAIGFPVLALTRMRIGPVVLKGLAPGTWRKLHPSEVKALVEAADSAPAAAPQMPQDRPEDFDRTADAPADPHPRSGERRRTPERAGPKAKTGAPRDSRAAAPVTGPALPAKPVPPRSAAGPILPGAPKNRNRTGSGYQPSKAQDPPSRPVGSSSALSAREIAAREAARRLAAQLDATPDDDDALVDEGEAKSHGAKPKADRPAKRKK